MYNRLSKLTPPPALADISGEKHQFPYNLGVLNVGAPACGMNAAMRAFVRLALTNGYGVMGIRFGFEGLVNDNVEPMSWTQVQGWAGLGGTRLGTTRTLPEALGYDKVAAALKKWNINGLLLVGGFESYQSVLNLVENRDKYPEFCIPMTCIPATISNNVPGSDFSLGADTALNEITSICDRIKQSASGTRNRVFVVETMGGYCGYLATMAGLAGGADAAYIFEEPFGIKDLQGDVAHLCAKIKDGVKRGLILRNEKANSHYTTDFIYNLYSEEGRGYFNCRMNILGHMQQGGRPSPFDRNMGTKMAAKCVEKIIDQIQAAKQPDGSIMTKDKNTATLLGMIKRQSTFTAVEDLKSQSDFKNRLPALRGWWMNLRGLLRILAHHDTQFEHVEAKLMHVTEVEKHDHTLAA